MLATFQPLPAVEASETNPITSAKVALGRMLYYDTRFSTSGDVSCYVCHPLHDYGTSHRSTGVGHDGKVGGRNEPTVFNAAGHVAQFWDGRSPDLEAQALGPVLNPVELGMPDANAVLSVLKGIPGYQDAFRAAFPGEPEPITFDNFGRAIGAFERGLVTPARWDDFLAGQADALTAEEQAGFKTFVDAGCAACHAGALVGGRLIPPPRVHRHRYHGVLAPNARLRPRVVTLARDDAEVSEVSTAAATGGQGDTSPHAAGAASGEHSAPGLPDSPNQIAARSRWARLLARIYEVFPLLCPGCGAEMRMLAFITAAEPVDAILRHLRLPATPPALSPARGPPQHHLGFDADPGFDLDQTPLYDPTEPEPVPDFDFDQNNGA